MKHLRIFISMEEFESTKPSIDTPFVVLEKGTPKVIYSNIKEITEPEIPNYLCFEAIEYSTLSFNAYGDMSHCKLEYAVGTGDFSTYTIGTEIQLNSGDKVYFRGDNSTISTGEKKYGHFAGTGKINISGNILSLLSKDLSPVDTLPNYCFYRLFSVCGAFVSAEKLILPFSKVGQYSCKNMFYNCGSLTTAPELLPAEKLSIDCYWGMFAECTSLTTAPILPATTLAGSCYYYMFSGCRSLTTAPSLPSTTLAQRCYWGMFEGCRSLTTAPELPATTLANYCYNSMFYNCSSLSRIKCLAEDISATRCTVNWVTGVASTGTFIKNANATNWSIGTGGIPSGWTVEDYTTDYLCFEAIEDNSTLRFVANGAMSYPNLEYSKDSENFSPCTSETVITLNTGDKVYFRGDNSTLSTGENDYGQFVGTGKINISGNILSILSKDLNQIDTAPDWCFYKLFSDCDAFASSEKLILYFNVVGNNSYKNMLSGCTSLTSAPALPATTLAANCYAGMFNGCTAITQAPALPATTLAVNCYGGMFTGCTSLTTAPVLPATTLAANCYAGMFNGCTAITQAPALTATTLADSCYNSMFNGCTSLTTAPELPATTLYESCYNSMFSGCSSLTTIKCLAKDISATECTNNWVQGVASSGTFIKSAGVEWETGVNGIPEGWIVEEYTEPEILDYLCFEAIEPSTLKFVVNGDVSPKLEYADESGNFNAYTIGDSISLNTGEKVYFRGDNSTISKSDNVYGKFDGTGKINISGNILSILSKDLNSIDTVPDSCFSNLFSNCKAIVSAKNLIFPFKKVGIRSYVFIFRGCTSLTTAPKILPATTLADNCYAAMFWGCSKLTTAPELPAKTLATNCYSNMFRECTSLTTAPELPAKTLADGCYKYMFYNCSKLSRIKCLCESYSYGSDNFRYWVNGVASSGTFTKNANATNWPNDTSGIPSGWTVENYTEPSQSNNENSVSTE